MEYKERLLDEYWIIARDESRPALELTAEAPVFCGEGRPTRDKQDKDERDQDSAGHVGGVSAALSGGNDRNEMQRLVVALSDVLSAGNASARDSA